MLLEDGGTLIPGASTAGAAATGTVGNPDGVTVTDDDGNRVGDGVAEGDGVGEGVGVGVGVGVTATDAANPVLGVLDAVGVGVGVPDGVGLGVGDALGDEHMKPVMSHCAHWSKPLPLCAGPINAPR